MDFANGADSGDMKGGNVHELRSVGNREYGEMSPDKEGEAYREGGTDYKDQMNMERLGKRQEFDVSCGLLQRLEKSQHSLTSCAAELQVTLNHCVQCHCNGWLDIRSQVRRIDTHRSVRIG